MHPIALDRLSSGMVLSGDVRDINGRLLLTKGTTIDDRHIRLLKIWGVPEVYTQPEPDVSGWSAPCDKDEQTLAIVRDYVGILFQDVDIRHPAIEALIHAAIEHRYQNGAFNAFPPAQPLDPDFNLALATGISTQIQFSDVELPESPAIISEYTKVADDPTASASDIADVIGRSPSLAAVLLKIANSSVFGLPSKISTISKAVTLLGTREVGALVMGIGVMRYFRDIPNALVDLTAFLRHSFACAILSRTLAVQAKLNNIETIFTAGLLHDIGRLVWYRYFPEQAKLLLEMARATRQSVFELERQCLGIGHDQIARRLLIKWKFPATLVDLIACHHQPQRSAQEGATLVHMADIAVNALGLGHSGEHLIPGCDTMAWDRLRISPNALLTAVRQAAEQLDIMSDLYLELPHVSPA